MRKLFLRNLFRCLNKEHLFIYFNETLFSQRKHSKKMWVKTNERQKNILRIKYKNYYLLLAISNEELFHYKIIEANPNSSIVSSFLKELIQIIKNKEEIKRIYESGRVTIVLDNATFHKTSDILNLSSINLLFNIPHFSCYYIIENAFSLLKTKFYNLHFKAR